MPPGTFKPTLQLRHQLNCSGIAIDAAAYDAQRHHLLTYDSHVLKPHTLRLFSLRREIRSTPLFDDDNHPPPVPPPPPPPSTRNSKPPPRAEEPGDPIASTVLRFVSLFYAAQLDVFVCVYSAYHTLPGLSSDAATGYSIVVLEPATLKKLVVYTGPRVHLLQCACLDEPTGRLVLASRIASPDPKKHRSSTAPNDHSNVLEVIAISKRPFRRPVSSSGSPVEVPVDRVMLCVEKLPRLTLWHRDPLECLAAAPRLQALFGSGAAYDESEDGDDLTPGLHDKSVVLEWRSTHESPLTLIRRVIHERDRITSVASSSSGHWLFTGHAGGILKVWDMTTTPEKQDDHPRTFAPVGDGASASPASHTSAVAMIEVQPVISRQHEHDEIETAMLYTTERGSGHTRHWRFSAVVSTAERTPQLDCLGRLDVDPTSQPLNSNPTKKRKRGALGDWIRTTPLSIAVQMGNYTENMLVVTRGDVIHVIKIQTLLQVVHEVPRGEEIFTLDSVVRRDGSVAVVCLSGTTSGHRLQLSEMDPQSAKISAPHEVHLSPPHPHVPTTSASRLTRMYVCVGSEGEAWIVCGWSTGVVEVYTEQAQTSTTPRRIALLQDPHLNVDITALAIVDRQHTNEKEQAVKIDPCEATHSWGGLFKSTPLQKHELSASYCTVLAGTASGAIFVWRLSHPSHSSPSASLFILEASTAVHHPPAHSAHVVELLSLSTSLLSMGAEGILKLWTLPSMRLEQHINAAASSGAGGTRLGMLCSCVQVLRGGDAIVVGFEDGAIAVWHKQNMRGPAKAVGDYEELLVSGRHERRVSSITRAGEMRFLTASLDMTIVLWAIGADTQQVEEVRFFDLGAPAVDCCVVDCIVLAGLRDEVCWFTWDEDMATREESEALPHLQDIVAQVKTDRMGGAEAEDALTVESIQPDDSSPRTSLSPRSPSPQEDTVISIPSVIVPESPSPVMLDSFPQHSHSIPSGPLEGWQTDQSNESPLDAEMLSLYVRQFITTYGAAGSIAAESLGHLLAMHRLPWSTRIKTRPDFFVRKYLHDCKIDPKTRLTAADATTLLLALQRAAVPEREDYMPSVKAIKASNGMRREALKRLAEPRRKKTTLVQCDKPTDNRTAVVTYNILGEKSIKWVSCSASNQEAGTENTPAVSIPEEIRSLPDNTESTPDDTTPSLSIATPSVRRRRRRKESSLKTVMAPATLGPPDRDLLNRIHLSSRFESLWSSGLCWCLDSPLLVQWENPTAAEEEGEGEAVDRKKSRAVKCSHCGHRRHRLTLQKKDYKPHFTARAILGIIADVYELMMPPAYDELYRNDATTTPSSTHEFTIHAALWKVFHAKFGVQHIVETKLKLLFLSMCHLVRSMDAIAVFGELLALFQRAEHDEQVPHQMVALCVATHGWLYAREMVINGKAIWGKAEASGDAVSKTTHWQFVSLTNALCCAQELLVYPLVSPGYLQTILLHMEEYAQPSATTPHKNEEEVHGQEKPQWIEVHRLLRFLVGEWKHQAMAFRSVERLLFTEPLAAAQGHHSAPEDPLAIVLEKLRLILSCFVFYDHDRVGLTELSDFENTLRRLKYLWPNEHLSEEEAAGANRFQDSLTFENTILASEKRFSDTHGDGRICYLDFWAMLYVVGVRTKSLLKFREIPSFCKDYRLEVSPALRAMLLGYMQQSSAMVLPRGFQTAKSSRHETTHHPHLRRVGRLYEGVYTVDTPDVTRTLSMQEFLRHEPTAASSGLYIDGAIPSMRQSASTTALDGFSRVRANGASDFRAREPVVVGVRPTGPLTKPTALLAVSSLGLAEVSEMYDGAIKTQEDAFAEQALTSKEFCHSHAQVALPVAGSPQSYANVCIQFPNVTPRKTRVEWMGLERSEGGPRTGDEEAEAWRQQFLNDHDHDEQERKSVHEEHKRRLSLQKGQAEVAAASTSASAAAVVAAVHHHHPGHGSPLKERPSPTKSEGVEAVTSSTRVEPEDPFVMIPTIDKHAQNVPLHGDAIIENSSRLTLQERRRLNELESTEFEPTATIVPTDLEILFPVASQDESPPSGRIDIIPDAINQEATMVVSSVVVDTPNDAPDSFIPQTPRLMAPELFEGEAENKVETENEKEDDVEDENNEKDGDDDPSEDAASDGGGDNEDDECESDSYDEEEPLDMSATDELQNVWVADDARTEVMPIPVVAEVKNVAEPTCAGDIQIPTSPPSQESALTSDPVERKPSGAQSEQPTEAVSTAVTQAASKQTLSAERAAAVSPTKPPTVTIQSSAPRSKSKPTTTTHRFKFSQQPKFKQSAALSSHPFRSKSWKPRDDSDSHDDSDDSFDDTVAVEDMHLHVSHRSLTKLQREFGQKKAGARSRGHAALASASASDGSPGHGLVIEDLYVDDAQWRKANTPVRLDEDAERALYGGRSREDLGEGIAFSAEEEAFRQHKWTDFFGTAEASMFSPLKEAMNQREESQRQQDELQSRLMKKRMEQQHLDSMRLQRNTSTSTGPRDEQTPPHEADDTANFRTRRMTREAHVNQQPILIGETATRELQEPYATEYFRFEYLADATIGFTIITFKLQVLQGEADLFLSTETMAPCASDCMWRSVEKCVVPTTTSTSASEAEGQKIVLFPHDITRVCRGPSGSASVVVFYLAVVAVAPHTSFTLGVMTSGQKTKPSRAIQTVDQLIAHFNQLSKTYEGQASRRRILTADTTAATTTATLSRSSVSSGVSSVDRLRAFLASAARTEAVDDEERGDGESPSQPVADGHSTESDGVIVETLLPGPVGDEDDHSEDSRVSDQTSFQQLLESLGQLHRIGLPPPRSVVLDGATIEQHEFLQDEEASYHDTKTRLSSSVSNPSLQLSQEDGTDTAVAVFTERRLSTASSLALQQRLGTRVKQKRLSPLQTTSTHDHRTQRDAASLRVALSEPKLVAYSLSSLPPPKHPLQPLHAAAPAVRTKNKR